MLCNKFAKATDMDIIGIAQQGQEANFDIRIINFFPRGL